MAQKLGDPLSDEEQIVFFRSATQRMAEFTFPYIASVIRVEDDDTGTYCGSAWRVATGGRRAIVTAAHVIEEACASGAMVAVTAQRGAPPFSAPAGEWKRNSSDDLAVWYLPHAYPDSAHDDSVAFWEAEAIDVSGDRIGTDFLFLHGFPQVRSRFSPGLGGVVNTSFPYGAMLRDEPMSEGKLGPHEFALHFEVEGLLASDAGSAPFIIPQGLSGAAVWRLDVGGRSISTWRPNESKLVGIAIRWAPDEQALVVVHARRVVALLRDGSG